MATKRMFDKAIIDTDRFMDLPMTAKAIYFLLGMEADDEGFVSYKKVIRIHGGNDDDVKILVTKNFLIGFPTGVVVITDWQKNNYLDKNRIKMTEYITEKAQLVTRNGKYLINTNVKPLLNHCLTSIEECSTEQSINNSEPSSPNIKDLYSTMGLPPQAKRKVSLWQDEAATAVKYFTDGEEKASSIFKAFKENNQKAKFAFSDCKELDKHSALYFFKVYNEISKK